MLLLLKNKKAYAIISRKKINARFLHIIKGGCIVEYTKKHQTILNNFKKTGEEFDFFLGSIYGGAQSSLEDLIAHAQVFANVKCRGALVSGKTFQYGLNKTERLGIHSGLCLNHNGEPQYTSYVLIDKNEDLGNVRETYTSAGFNPLYANANSTNLSEIVSSLENMAEEIEVETKILGITRKKQLKLVQKQISNPVCSCVDKIYQVAYAKLDNNFNTNLEKVTAAILATYITTKALDLKGFDARTDEALRMNFCTHLNGCYANGSLALSNVIKNGVDLGVELIETMGYGKDDVKAKCERLGTPLQNEPKSLNEALFGAKQIEKSLSVFVNEEKKATTFTAVSEDKEEKKSEETKDEIEEKVKGAVSTSIVPAKNYKHVIIDADNEGVSNKNNIAKPGQKIAKIDEEIYPQGTTVVGPDETSHKIGNAINFNTLRDNLLKKIIVKLDEKANAAANRAEKKRDFDAVTESNFWTGASDGIAGRAGSKGRTAAYYEGHKLGSSVRNGIIYEISKFYSPDKKTLLRDVVGKGPQITTILGDEAVKECGMNTFSEFIENVVSSFAKALEKFKNKTTNTSTQPTP